MFREDNRDPSLSLHREVNRLFDDVFRDFVSVPRNDGGHVLSEKEREILAAEHAQDLGLHLAECLINRRGETPGVNVRRF